MNGRVIVLSEESQVGEPIVATHSGEWARVLIKPRRGAQLLFHVEPMNLDDPAVPWTTSDSIAAAVEPITASSGDLTPTFSHRGQVYHVPVAKPVRPPDAGARPAPSP